MKRIMKMLCAVAVVGALVVALSACNGDDGNTVTYSLDGAGYVVITSGTLQHNSTNVSGSGSIVFNDPLPGIASKSSFELSFTIQDGGSLTLGGYSSNQLANGVNVVMSRSGATLSVVLEAEGNQNDVSALFTGIDASGTIGVQIDIHNDETPAHILAWNGQDFDEAAAIFNSENDGDTPGNGAGSFWGLILEDAVVSTAAAGDAKFVEP
jgi:hypothetical protein